MDLIFYVGAVNGTSAFGPLYSGTVYHPLVNITYEGGLEASQTFGLYWFPGLTAGNNTVPVEAFAIGGFQANSSNLGDISMVLPSDGLYDVYQVDHATAALDGEFSPISPLSFTAISVHAAIPEPTTAATVALGLLAMLRRRARKN